MADSNTFGIAGLLGWPVAQSRSPVIHNHWLSHYGIAGRYVLFPLPPGRLQSAAGAISRLRVGGGGGGGAGAGVASLAAQGATEIRLANRTLDKAREIADAVGSVVKVVPW